MRTRLRRQSFLDLWFPALFTHARAINKPPEPQSSAGSQDCCADKISLRANAPKPRAQKWPGRYDTISNQIRSAIGPAPQFRLGLGNDQRFARGLTEFLQASHSKGQGQPRK